MPAVLLMFLCLAISLVSNEMQSMLHYERDAILQGEIWRLLTGHLVHLGWGHLGLNIAGLFLLALWGSKYLSPFYWLTAVIFSALGIGLGLLWLRSDIFWYVGLSGVLHSLLVLVILRWQQMGHHYLGAAFISLLVLKIAWEQWVGPLPGSTGFVGGAIIVDAHLYGAISGLLFFLLMNYRDRFI